MNNYIQCESESDKPVCKSDNAAHADVLSGGKIWKYVTQVDGSVR